MKWKVTKNSFLYFSRYILQRNPNVMHENLDISCGDTTHFSFHLTRNNNCWAEKNERKTGLLSSENWGGSLCCCGKKWCSILNSMQPEDVQQGKWLWARFPTCWRRFSGCLDSEFVKMCSKKKNKWRCCAARDFLFIRKAIKSQINTWNNSGIYHNRLHE
jgi:hypothetical protein